MKGASPPEAQRRQEFDEWYRQYGNVVLHTCFLYLRDRALAEDAMQETFVKAWHGMDQFEGRNQSNVKTWLIRIALNTCADFKRTAWFRHVDLSTALESLPPAMMQVEQESRDAFLDVLRLPDKYRQVVLVHIFDQLTIKETASMLHISSITVIRRLKKAYALLRLSYQEGGKEHETGGA